MREKEFCDMCGAPNPETDHEYSALKNKYPWLFK